MFLFLWYLAKRSWFRENNWFVWFDSLITRLANKASSKVRLCALLLLLLIRRFFYSNAVGKSIFVIVNEDCESFDVAHDVYDQLFVRYCLGGLLQQIWSKIGKERCHKPRLNYNHYTHCRFLRNWQSCVYEVPKIFSLFFLIMRIANDGTIPLLDFGTLRNCYKWIKIVSRNRIGSK